MEEKAITKEMNTEQTTVHEITHTDSELYKVGIYTTAAFAAAVGIWGLICLASSISENGSPVEIFKSLFSAITGA